MDGLKNLLASRKAVITLLALVCLTALVIAGKVDPKEFMQFLTVTLPVYLGAQGLEDAAAKYNPLPPSENPNSSNTLPPSGALSYGVGIQVRLSIQTPSYLVLEDDGVSRFKHSTRVKRGSS